MKVGVNDDEPVESSKVHDSSSSESKKVLKRIRSFTFFSYVTKFIKMNRMPLIVLVLCVSAVVDTVADMSCIDKWSLLGEDDDECYTKTGVKPQDLKKLLNSEEDYIKSGYDDKCFGKCYLENLKFVKNNTLDNEAIKANIKKEARKDIQDKVVEFAFKCMDAAESLVKDEGGFKGKICKASAYIVFCWFKEQAKLLELPC